MYYGRKLLNMSVIGPITDEDVLKKIETIVTNENDIKIEYMTKVTPVHHSTMDFMQRYR